MYIPCSWSVLAPSGTTWTQFAFDTGSGLWKDWNDLCISEPTCPKIQVDNCCTSTNTSSLSSIWTHQVLPTIAVYTQSNNLNIIRLINDTDYVWLDDVTKIELRLDTGTTISSVDYPTAITWATGAGMQGRVYLKLGNVGLEAKSYSVQLMVFDAVNILGLFWGYFRIRGVAPSG